MSTLVEIFYKHSRWVVLLVDVLLVVLANITAYLLRFEFHPVRSEMLNLVTNLPYLVVIKVCIFYLFHAYQGMWRYTSLADILRLLYANILAQLIIVALIGFVGRFEGLSRSVYILDGFFCFIYMAGFRGLLRHYLTYIDGGRLEWRALLSVAKSVGRKNKRVVIVGAGDAGEALAREIINNPKMDYNLIGFLDDDRRKRGRAIHGIPVLDEVSGAHSVVEKFKIERIFIATPSASGEQMRHIVASCEKSGVPYQTLPGLGLLMDGMVSVKALRDVNYEDLLGRLPVELDESGILDCLEGRTVLITGAGGSIGSELCRQVATFRPARMILLDNSEYNLFRIDAEMEAFRSSIKIITILGSIQDQSLMEDIFGRLKPQVVFHAAAYKHVHLVEQHPWEGVFNNIKGSQIVMRMAKAHDIERFVLVSTDKAVRPVNVMGACKRASELILREMGNGRTKFMAVRFGNVIGSSGSVIPLFREQIAQGGPVTVTDPKAERFFMTIPEAARLICQAAALGEGGDIFVLEMGTPVNILEMAKDLIRLSGKEPYRDIDIQITGLRKGEKEKEELFIQQEKVTKTRHGKIMRLMHDGQEGPPPASQDFALSLSLLYQVAESRDALLIKKQLAEVVPEYTPQL